jgi:hypothetical protein
MAISYTNETVLPVRLPDPVATHEYRLCTAPASHFRDLGLFVKSKLLRRSNVGASILKQTLLIYGLAGADFLRPTLPEGRISTRSARARIANQKKPGTAVSG